MAAGTPGGPRGAVADGLTAERVFEKSAQTLAAKNLKNWGD
jgi:hypothetical protein